MSYEPTVWKDGDLVTSAKLNKMEQGIARNDVVECTTENNIMTLNKTWQEIWDNNYTSVMIIDDSSKMYGFIMGLYKATDDNPYIVGITTTGSPQTFVCLSPDDYPSYGGSSQAKA